MEKLAKTPWCSSDYIYDDELISTDEIERLVGLCTGSCPSGVTFDRSVFRRELEKAVGRKLRFASVGGVANLPWGRVSDAIRIGVE